MSPIYFVPVSGILYSNTMITRLPVPGRGRGNFRQLNSREPGLRRSLVFLTSNLWPLADDISFDRRIIIRPYIYLRNHLLSAFIA